MRRFELLIDVVNALLVFFDLCNLVPSPKMIESPKMLHNCSSANKLWYCAGFMLKTSEYVHPARVSALLLLRGCSYSVDVDASRIEAGCVSDFRAVLEFYQA